MLRHAVFIIVLTVSVTVFMGYQALKIKIDTNVNTLLPQDNPRISRIRKNVGVENESTNSVFVSISGENLYTLEVLGAFQDTIDEILSIPDFNGVLSPFNFIHFDVQGRRIIPTTISGSGEAPKTPEELIQFKARVLDNPLSENFIVSDNGRILTAMFITESADDSVLFMEAFENAMAPLKKLIRVRYTGEVPFQDRVAKYLSKDFSLLLVLALLAMLTIFWLSFRSFRAVILPIAVVCIGVVWSLGFMAMMGYKITVVSVIIPSLILTIGSSYTIHVLNEYYRNTGSAVPADKNQWLASAVEHVIRTVIVAALTTMLCFLSLTTTTLNLLREFGLSISVGIFSCALLALFFLPSVFYLMRIPQVHHRERMRKGLLARIVSRFGHWASRHRFITAGIFLTMFVSFLLCYPHIQHQSDYFSYFPTSDTIVEDTRFINRNSGGSQMFNITLNAPNNEPGYFLRPDVLQQVDLFEIVLRTHPSITHKLSFNSILKSMNKAVQGKYAIPESAGLIQLLSRYFRMIPTDKISLGQEAAIINDDASSITIYLRMAEAETFNLMGENDVRLFHEFVMGEAETAFGDSLDSYFWGNTILLLDSSRTIKRDQFRSTLISIALGMVVTAVFFRSFIYSVIVLIPLLSGIFFYFITLFLSGIPLDMTTILVTNVTVGVGLDDAIHFILQYRKQRSIQPFQLSLMSSLRITGRPIVLTTLSLIAGLLMLFFASFKPIVYFGFLVAGTLFSTMMGTIIFIPAAISFYETVRTARRRKKGS